MEKGEWTAKGQGMLDCPIMGQCFGKRWLVPLRGVDLAYQLLHQFR